MKLTLLASALFALTATCSPIEARDEAQAHWARVTLAPPLNWLAGPRLFPTNVIAGYNAEIGDYNAESWAQKVLKECAGFAAATSSESYSAMNSGTPKIRYWFGFCYRGGPTTPADYVREEGVENSIAYTKC